MYFFLFIKIIIIDYFIKQKSIEQLLLCAECFAIYTEGK